MSRPYTNKILEAVDDGIFDAEYALRGALNYMSESEVECMINNMPEFEHLREDGEDIDHLILF